MRAAFLAIAALAVVLMLPSFIWGPLAIDSATYNVVWTQQFGEALARGELYPRWLPGSFEGLGSPTFYFYPPLAFYLTGGLDQLGLDVGGAINAGGLVVLFASGAAMYAWLKFKGGRALLGACLYMAAPYHLIDFYLRAALAEFSAFIWLPLIALAIEAYPQRWAGPLLALAFAGLTMTHLPMAILVGLGLICPMVVREVLVRRDGRLLLGYALAGAAGLAIAAIYLVPALTLQPLVSTTVLWGSFYQPGSWSLLSHNGVVTPAVLGWPAPIAGLSVVLAGTAAYLSRRNKAREPRFWGGVTIVCALLGLALVPGFWLLPVLDKVQFPWRIFAVMEFAAVTAICLSPSLPRRAWQAAAVLAAACYVRLVMIGVQVAAQGGLPAEVTKVLPDAAEYLPAGFDMAGIDHINRQPDLIPFRGPAAQGPVSRVESAGGGELRLEVSRPGTVTIRRFAFPAWQVERDGKPVETRAAGPGRLIAFDAQPGAYRLVRTTLPQERHGLWLSLLGLALLVPLSLRRGRRSR